MARLFIALPFQKKIISMLNPTFDYLRKYDTILKVVSPQNYHITLKFLGKCDDNLAKTIKNRFTEILVQKEEISFTITGIGAFPNVQRASVIWYGLKTEEKIVDTIYRSVEKFSSQFGFQAEKRKFTPHLTLARVRKGKKITNELIEFIEKNRDKRFGESSFKKLTLYSSMLTPQGPIYSELKSISLV